MAAGVVGRIGMVLAAMVVLGGGCGDSSSEDDRQCRTCTVSENCENDQECVLAIDGQRRCFELDRETCTLDRVPVGRAPVPVP